MPTGRAFPREQPRQAAALSTLAQPHVLFIVFASLFGSLLLFTTPPFQVADEIAHFDRAFKLSEFETFQQVRNGRSGASLPTSIGSAFAAFDYLRFRSNRKTDVRRIMDSLRIPLDNDKREFVQIDAGGYFYFSYIPQLPAIFVGRAFGLNVVYILYLGRLMAMAFYVAGVAYAINIIPIGKVLLSSVALMPMCLAQAGSFNADSVLYTLCFLGISIVIRLSIQYKRLEFNIDTVLLVVVFLIMGILKPVYLPLVLLLFLAPRTMLGSATRYFTITLSIIFLSGALGYIWQRSQAAGMVSAIASSGRVQSLLDNPLMFASVIGNTWQAFNRGYYTTTIGVLGYLDTVLPEWVYTCFALLLLGAALLESNGDFVLRIRQRIILLLASVGVVLCIILAMYLATRPEAGLIAEGVQGRYLIPAVFPFLLSFHGLLPVRINLSRHRGLLLATFAVLFIALCSTEMTLLDRYYFVQR